MKWEAVEGYERSDTTWFRFVQDRFGGPVEDRLLVSKNNRNGDQLGGTAIIQAR